MYYFTHEYGKPPLSIFKHTLKTLLAVLYQILQL
jgi:hypothetical protein